MDWKKERDLLIAQTLAFVQSVTGKAPDVEAKPRLEAAPRLETVPAEAPDINTVDITAVEILAAEIIAPSRDAQVSINIPRSIVSSDIRTEMQARVTNFRAHQERFHREREEYFSATLREARAGLVTPRPLKADAGSRSSPAPAANVLKIPEGSRSSESGQGAS